jgi:hypothetical protein
VQQRLHAADLSEATVQGIAQAVVAVVGERWSTWRRWNLHAEASRQLQGVRFATTGDRDHVLDRVVARAEVRSVRLTPPDLATVPAELQRPDGTIRLRPRHSVVYTSADLLAAEDDLLRLTDRTDGPCMPVHTLTGHAGGLGEDQVAAVVAVAMSGRVVDVLVRPAGAGKTTTMRALKRAWAGLYGAGSVLGLAPSAAAAEILGVELEVPADTLAKWLHNHDTDGTGLQAGRLMTVDEASLAGTRALHRLAVHATDVGAKVLLVGDPDQLAAVDVGGAFTLLTRDPPAVQLTDVGFHQPWEAAATLQMRDGNPAVLGTYAAHGRLHEGDTERDLDGDAGGVRGIMIDTAWVTVSRRVVRRGRRGRRPLRESGQLRMNRWQAFQTLCPYRLNASLAAGVSRCPVAADHAPFQPRAPTNTQAVPIGTPTPRMHVK